MSKFSVGDRIQTIHGTTAKVVNVRRRNGVTEYQIVTALEERTGYSAGQRPMWLEEEEISHKVNSQQKMKIFGDDLRNLARRKTPMALSVGATGGYLVPPEIAIAIDEGFQESSIFATLAYNQPMTSEQITLPRVDLTASHVAGTSPLLGGLAISWFKENQTVPTSNMNFKGITLVARNGGVLVYVTDDLVADGGEPLAAYVQFIVSQALAFEIDYRCLNGSGLAEPLGIRNSPATLNVARQFASHVTQTDLANMVSKLVPACFKRAIWIGSVSTLADIANLSTYMANRNSDSTVNLGLCGTLFGRPFYATEKLPALGTQGDLLLIDPMLYVLGSRMIDIAVGNEVSFLNRQTVYRFIWRGDGQPLVGGTATLADGTSTAGVFVSLQ